jgi:outer membrane murein-binding lipoprotein Lpp
MKDMEVISVSTLQKFSTWQYTNPWYDSNAFEDLQRYLRHIVERANGLVEIVVALGQQVNRWQGRLSFLDPERMEAMQGQLAELQQAIDQMTSRVNSLATSIDHIMADLQAIQSRMTAAIGPSRPAHANQGVDDSAPYMQTLATQIEALQADMQGVKARLKDPLLTAPQGYPHWQIRLGWVSGIVAIALSIVTLALRL